MGIEKERLFVLSCIYIKQEER
ncbi:hypothetical protein PT2222_180043 [Paraburkholderia tropica]